MAERGETRDPSSHRTPGQIKRKNKGYDARPENVKKRANNNAARAMLERKARSARATARTCTTSSPSAPADRTPAPI